MRDIRVAFGTLGCKLNQLETESIASSFSDSGAALCSFSENADLYILNTCTVTGKAEQKARRMLRQAQQKNPSGVVLVTGCYAQMDPQAILRLALRVVVVSGNEKSAILSLASWLQDHWQGHGDLFEAVCEWNQTKNSQAGKDPISRFAFNPTTFAFHSRPSLKIQDGCDNRCTYCRVCIARGPSVSLDPAIILSRVLELEAAGKSEIILTGINLSHYSCDGMEFPGLLSFLIDRTSFIRFRISSYEPERIRGPFIEAFANPRIQPHIHLSMQSGSDSVLGRMARAYRAETVVEAVRALRSVRDDPFIAADVIAGFPGESDAEFEETLKLCEKLDFAWIHAFPFSARPGTKAFDMRPKIPERISRERTEALAALAKKGKEGYIARWIGREVDVIIEKETQYDKDDQSGDTVSAPSFVSVATGTSSNYLKVRISGLNGQETPGNQIRATIMALSSEIGIDVLGCVQPLRAI
jgi:threonylcarbamoyladenosine tRNA methylthiotransferase MtaB